MAVLFPSFGPMFQSSLIAVILINQVVGPVLFRVAARAVGDAGKADANGEEWDEDMEMPIALVLGTSPDALGVTSRLLSDHWAVTLVCTTPEEAAHAEAEMKRFGQESRAKHHTPATAMQQLGSAASRAVALPGQALEKAASAAAHRIAALDDSAGAEEDLEGTPLVGAGTSSSDTPEVDEHGHVIRKVEDSFHALVASLDLSASDKTDSPARLQQQLVALLAGVDAKQLSACVLAAADDDANLRIASSLRAIVDAAPKKSPLRALRRLALVQSAAAGAAFEAEATMPVHTASHAALLAAKLLSTQLAKPVTVFGAVGAAADRCRAVGAVLRSGRSAEPEPDGSPRRVSLVPDSPLMAVVRSTVPRSFADLMRGLKSMVEVPESEAGDLAGLDRRSYLDQVSTMHEHTPVGADVLGPVSQRSRAAGLAEMQLFSSRMDSEEDNQR